MRSVRGAAAMAVVLVASSGCGLGAALGQAPPSAAATSSTEASAAGPPATSTAATPAEVVMAVVPGSPEGRPDLLTVTRGRVQTGLVPPMSGWPADCAVDYPALQYVPILVEFTGAELAGRLTVTTTAATPTDIGPMGVFFDGAAEPYCQDDPAFGLVDTFWSHGNGGRTTAYVVLQDAVTAATPTGRPDVFGTLEVRIDDLRRHAAGDEPLRLAQPTVGATCPDDADALCVPLP